MLKKAVLFLALALSPPLHAESAADQALLETAQKLAKQYDNSYGAKDIDGMTKVYAKDAILISPSGLVVKGR